MTISDTPGEGLAAETVWIVEATVGEYSDRRDWTIGAWADEAEAKAFVARMHALGQTFEEAEKKRWDSDEDEAAADKAAEACRAEEPGWSDYCGEAPVYRAWPEQVRGRTPSVASDTAGSAKRWFQGETSFPVAKLRVYAGDSFRNRLVATFENEADAENAVRAVNALTALASQPVPDHAGLVELVEEIDIVVADGDRRGIAAAVPTSIGARRLLEKASAALREAIAALGRVEPVACVHDWEKTHEDACMFVCSKCREAFTGNIIDKRPSGWTGKYQSRYATSPAPQPALAPEALQRGCKCAVIRSLIERAFRDGVAYATNVDVKDVDLAWQTSKVRALANTQEGGDAAAS